MYENSFSSVEFHLSQGTVFIIVLHMCKFVTVYYHFFYFIALYHPQYLGFFKMNRFFIGPYGVTCDDNIIAQCIWYQLHGGLWSIRIPVKSQNAFLKLLDLDLVS